MSVSKSKCPSQCPPPGFLEVGQAPSTFSQITALVCVGQRAYLRVPRVPAKPLVHRQSHFDTQLGPLPPTATVHCCCTHTCEYNYVHARKWMAEPRPVQTTSTLFSQCHPSAVGTMHTTNVGQLEPVKRHKIACTVQPVT